MNKDIKSQGVYAKGRTIVNCSFCGVHIERCKSDVKGKKHNFCNNTCRGNWLSLKHGASSPNWRGGKIKVRCDFCGKLIEKIPFHIKNSERHFCDNKCRGEWLSINNVGSKNGFWNGGVSSINKQLRGSMKYSLWRDAVFIRDDWTCRSCYVKGGKLNAHHKKCFSKYPELRFDINNGITLCKKCHNDLHKTRGYFTNA